MESYTCTEYINVDNLNKIIKAKKFDEPTIKSLINLRRHAKSGTHTVEFLVKDKKARTKSIGRMYPKFNHPSLQGLKRDIRKALAYDSCIDLDIKNAHPVILSQILHLNDIECKSLDYYVNHREDVLSMYEDREQGKQRYTTLMNGGKSKDVEFENLFYEDVFNATSKLFRLAKYEIYYKKGEVDRPSNAHGSAVSFLCQDYERHCLTSIIEKLKDLNYEPSTIIHDGLLIHTKELLDDHIQQIEDYVYDQNHIRIQLAVKPMNDFDETLLWDTDTSPDDEDRAVSHILIDKLLEWAYENKLYRHEDYGVLQSTDVPYWAEPRWTEPKQVINEWLRDAPEM